MATKPLWQGNLSDWRIEDGEPPDSDIPNPAHREPATFKLERGSWGLLLTMEAPWLEAPVLVNVELDQGDLRVFLHRDAEEEPAPPLRVNNDGVVWES